MVSEDKSIPRQQGPNRPKKSLEKQNAKGFPIHDMQDKIS
jgi:hypothetical protein